MSPNDFLSMILYNNIIFVKNVRSNVGNLLCNSSYFIKLKTQN